MEKIFHKIINSKIVAVSLLLFFLAIYTPIARADSLSAISDTLSRIKTGETANHTIAFTTPSGIQNTDTITFTFPASSFSMGGTLSGVTISEDSGTDHAVGAATYAANVLTITADADSIVTAGHIATIKIPSTQITNPAADTYVVSIGGTFNDTGSFAISIIANDQFTVDATVDPSITFTLNDTAVDLGTVDVSAVSTDTTSFTVNTNASGGYSVTVLDDGNLRSGTDDINNVGDGTVTKNYEEYGISTSKAGQTVSQTSGDANAQAATALSSSTAKSCASSGSPVSSDSTTLSLHAAVAGTTPAGSYSQIVTVIATGNF